MPLQISPEDPLMQDATEKARAGLARFRELLAGGHGAAAVKFPLATGSGNTEHVWADVLEQENDRVKVRVITPPVSHSGQLERVYTKSLDEIEDWQVSFPDGKIEGGYTMRVMFKRGREQWGKLPPDLEALEKKYGAA